MELRKMLENPFAYDFFQRVIGNKKRHKILKEEYIKNVEGKRILELGCGTCDLLASFEKCTYIGIDLEEKYIERAKKRFLNRKDAQFFCMDLNEYAEECTEKFDLIMMTGVIHHINDEEWNKCFSTIKGLLKENGTFFSFDPVYVDGMSKFERLLSDLDRGQYVRHADEYVSVHKKYFKNVFYQIRRDTMNLPFNIIIFVDSN